jgi:hypothetical protein
MQTSLFTVRKASLIDFYHGESWLLSLRLKLAACMHFSALFCLSLPLSLDAVFRAKEATTPSTFLRSTATTSLRWTKAESSIRSTCQKVRVTPIGPDLFQDLMLLMRTVFYWVQFGFRMSLAWVIVRTWWLDWWTLIVCNFAVPHCQTALHCWCFLATLNRRKFRWMNTYWYKAFCLQILTVADLSLPKDLTRSMHDGIHFLTSWIHQSCAAK